MKARGIPSPDMGDALALTWGGVVLPKPDPRAVMHNSNMSVVEYDDLG
jgi:hypothetical protein